MFENINKYSTGFFAVDIANLLIKVQPMYETAKAHFDEVDAAQPDDSDEEAYDLWYDEQDEAFESYETFSQLVDLIDDIKELNVDSWEELSAKLDLLTDAVESLGLDD